MNRDLLITCFPPYLPEVSASDVSGRFLEGWDLPYKTKFFGQRLIDSKVNIASTFRFQFSCPVNFIQDWCWSANYNDMK